MISRSHWAVYLGSEASEIGQLYKRAMADRTPVMLDHLYRWEDGREAWLEMRAYPVGDGLAVFYRDVSGRKADELALRTSEAERRVSAESLRLSTEAAEIGTWDLDLATDTLTWSDRTKAMFGISPHVPCSMADFHEGLHPDDRAATSAAFASALDPATRTTYAVEYRTVGKEDGVVRLVAAKGRALFDEAGRAVRAIGTATDITRRCLRDHRRAALIELNDRLRDTSDVRQLSYAAAEILGRTMGVSRAGYGTVDTIAETITIERDCNAPGIERIAGEFQFREYGSYIEDLKRGDTGIVTDARTDPRTRATAGALEGISARAFINMPVTEQGGFVALLFLNQATPRDWSDAELAFVREFGDRTRVAIERRRAEQDLRENEALLRAIFDAVPVGIVFAKAPSGRITGGNAQAERIFGHPVLPSADVDHYREWTAFHPDGRQVEGAEYPLTRAIRTRPSCPNSKCCISAAMVGRRSYG